MRDPARIDKYIEKLRKIWSAYPDLRFSQLMINVLVDIQNRLNKDIFYIEDEQLFVEIETTINNWKKGV